MMVLRSDGYTCYCMIYSWVISKKNQTPPTEEISAFHGGRWESYKGCLEFVQDVHKGEGGDC